MIGFFRKKKALSFIPKCDNGGKEKKKVFVGVSGGVDSSVAAALLKDAGYDVTGVFIKVWHPDFVECKWKDEMRDAMRVCATLEIPFKMYDLSETYKNQVIDYMISEYENGRTPNPDVMCNKSVKFGDFLKKAIEEGADFVATGHYAYSEKDSENTAHLYRGKDYEKDQTYFLWTLTQKKLKKAIFPVGYFKKSFIRKLAAAYKLPTADKKDSQGLCFIGHVDVKDFLKKYVDVKEGDVLDKNGEKIGYHDGALLYTIGERHGFTINHKTENDEAMYIVSKDLEKNTITVSKEKPSQKLNSKDVHATNLSLIQEGSISEGDMIDVQFRYRQNPAKAKVIKISESENESEIFIKLQDEIDAPAPGQSLVLYKEHECLGGAILS